METETSSRKRIDLSFLLITVPAHGRRWRWRRLVFRILSSVRVGSELGSRGGFDSSMHVSGRGFGGEDGGTVR